MESSRKCSTKKVEVFNFTTNMSIETSDIPVAITGSASVLIRFETKVSVHFDDDMQNLLLILFSPLNFFI